MSVGGLVRLLAIKVSGLVAVDGQIERLEFGDIILVDVLEIRVDFGPLKLGARVREGGFREGMVDSAEVKVDGLTNGNLGKIWGIKLENRPLLQANGHGRYCATCSACR